MSKPTLEDIYARWVNALACIRDQVSWAEGGGARRLADGADIASVLLNEVADRGEEIMRVPLLRILAGALDAMRRHDFWVYGGTGRTEDGRHVLVGTREAIQPHVIAEIALKRVGAEDIRSARLDGEEVQV